jgi:hypothetical protein
VGLAAWPAVAHADEGDAATFIRDAVAWAVSTLLPDVNAGEVLGGVLGIVLIWVVIDNLLTGGSGRR